MPLAMRVLASLALTFTVLSAAHALPASENQLVFDFQSSLESVDSWLGSQVPQSAQALVNNISPENFRGAVCASPSKSDPDYYYHWVRDAALVMDVIRRQWVRTGDDKYKQMMFDYIRHERQIQGGGDAPGGLGEPKYYMDGRPYTGPWGRPQNDGPALRASAIIRFANEYLARGGDINFVRDQLYDGRFPSNSVVKRDLEYVSSKYQDTCFDLWEEVNAHNFYTRMVQKRSLEEGAEFARHLGDNGAADWYQRQASTLAQQLRSHWNGRYIKEHLDRQGGLDYKAGLDTSTILAALHTSTKGEFGVTDERILATANELIRSFKSIYSINSQSQVGSQALGVAIGRYAEDRYDGHGNSRGNPWVLLTNAMAEYHYKLVESFTAANEITVTPTSADFFLEMPTLSGDAKRSLERARGGTVRLAGSEMREVLEALYASGDAFLRRTQLHTPRSALVAATGKPYSLSEQFNRDTGFMQGAENLTWSHASMLTSTWAREDAKKALTAFVKRSSVNDVRGG